MFRPNKKKDITGIDGEDMEKTMSRPRSGNALSTLGGQRNGNNEKLGSGGLNDSPKRDGKSDHGMLLSMKQQIKASKLRRAAAQSNASKENMKKLKRYQINPSDPTAAGDLVSLITPIRQPTNLVANAHKNIPNLTNECLMALRVKAFEFSGNSLMDNHTTANDFGIRKNLNNMSRKARNKFKYIVITRSTNAALMKRRKGNIIITGDDGGEDENYDFDEDQESSSDEENDVDSNDGYDTLYNPDDNDDNPKGKQTRRQSIAASVHSRGTKSKASNAKESEIMSDIDELSSFPNLVCLTIHSDGTHPDVCKILPLDQLVAIESVGNAQAVQLVFQNGVVAEIDFELKSYSATIGEEIGSDGSSSLLKPSYNQANATKLKKERFLWSLLQIHAILCTSVVERKRSGGDGAMTRGGSSRYITSSSTSALPTLTMRNVDRAELQYISTVNGFLSDSPVLCALLEKERQRHTAAALEKDNVETSENLGRPGREGASISEEKKSAVDEMDGIAYDMIMGNFSHLTLFLTEEEKKDAEEVLNSTIWQDGKTSEGSKVNIDEISTAETLTGMLQKRMRDLEAETCRRLIAWEDEKYYNSTGNIPMHNRRDSMEALSLSVLFQTLDDLDDALEGMEEWLSDKAAVIKPLTDDCREVEEENRQLGFQRSSYRLISAELKRLLSGLEVPDDVETILKDPTSKMVYHADGNIDIEKSQAGVEDIYLAGRALKEAFDKIQDEGGVHLRGVKHRVEGLLTLSNSFCDTIATTITLVMERTVAEIVGNDDFDYLSSTHATIGKSIRVVSDLTFVFFLPNLIVSYHATTLRYNENFSHLYLHMCSSMKC